MQQMLRWSVLVTSALLVHSATNSEWQHTINVAGLQRTLGQKMSKEFLLVSLGIDSAENKAKMQQNTDSFNSTLHALISGDASQGIVGAPNQQVADYLQEVLDLWIPFESLLRNNVDTVRYADGSANLTVLEAISLQNGPLLAACNAVVGVLVDAAKADGASTNGLVLDIAGRQRTYIQSLCLQSLLISQGASLKENMAALKETKLLFEASHQGIIQGVPFAGLPILTNMCTLHQMSEVTYYYGSIRPLYSEILNARTDHISQEIALRLAADIATFTEPLFNAMLAAVQRYSDESIPCDPISSMSDADWRSFIDTLGELRLRTQEVSQYFMQVALESSVDTSKVRITVMLSAASQNMRSLIEGRIAEGIPAPPTQVVVDRLLIAADAWRYLESELTQGVRADNISTIMVDRVAQLSVDVLEQLTEVMDTTVQEALRASPSTPSYLLDVMSQQAVSLSRLSKEASLVLYGIQSEVNWERLNATSAAFVSRHWKLLMGAPSTNATPALTALTDVCSIRKMREVEDLYAQLQEAALAVARGSFADMANMDRLNPQALAATTEATGMLSHCDSQNATAVGGATLLSWLELHREAANLAQLSQEAAAAFTIAQQEGGSNLLQSAMEEVEATARRLKFGSWQPHVAAPPTQALLDQVMSTVQPSVESFQQALGGSDVLAVVNQGMAVLAAAKSLQGQYLEGAMALDPAWPGARVDVAMGQVTLARQVFKEALLYMNGFRTSDDELTVAIGEFETSHRHLKEGGGGLSAIIVERNDILAQWEQINQAWASLKAQALAATSQDTRKLEEALNTLTSELTAAIPLYGMEDVEAPAAFPWTVAIYSSVGTCLLCCCCVIAYCQWAKDGPKPEAGSSKRGADQV